MAEKVGRRELEGGGGAVSVEVNELTWTFVTGQRLVLSILEAEWYLETGISICRQTHSHHGENEHEEGVNNIKRKTLTIERTIELM